MKFKPIQNNTIWYVESNFSVKVGEIRTAKHLWAALHSSHYSHACYTPRWTHSPWVKCLNNIWWEMQIIEILVLQFCPTLPVAQCPSGLMFCPAIWVISQLQQLCVNTAQGMTLYAIPVLYLHCSRFLTHVALADELLHMTAQVQCPAAGHWKTTATNRYEHCLVHVLLWFLTQCSHEICPQVRRLPTFIIKNDAFLCLFCSSKNAVQ
jgi:hypothetical protein